MSSTSTKTGIERPIIAAVAVLLALSTQAAAEDRSPYSAQEAIRRAGVGTYSPRLAPPVRVAPVEQGTGGRDADRFERMECRDDPVQKVLVCKPRYPKK